MTQYNRIASPQEIDCIEFEMDHPTLRAITKAGEIHVDEDTKSPYIVFNKVRYDIEPIVEENNERNIQNTKKI